MTAEHLISRAGAPLLTVVGQVRPDQLTSPTPCTGYDVRQLINHLLFWGPSLEGAGNKEAVPPPAEAESAMDLTKGDWSGDLATQVQRTIAAWTTSEAWQGTTRMAGPDELPSALIGGMVATELVVHGWDLGTATGQQPSWDDEVLEYVHQEVAGHAEWGRQVGSYGPEVPVAATAPLLDRILGLTGRAVS
ncbi:TIGR03086 family metal-binding protein [Kribbella sancticallisti]